MVKTKRSHHNPLIMPNNTHNWEASAAFNGSVVRVNSGEYHMLYRAISIDQLYSNVRMQLSTVGYAWSGDGIHFKRRRQLIVPEYEWERYGCEDPRVTKIGDTYYIFYTAISNWPPNAAGIKVAVATSRDLKTIDEKHPVTPFNAKATVLFPEKINGKYAAILTAHTDMPPSKISLALFDRIEDVWNPDYWKQWYEGLDSHVIPIQHTDKDQLEVGAVPVATDSGWILVIGYVQNYFSQPRLFRIDAVLLDHDNPQKVIGQTMDPILAPEEQYEIYGQVPNTIFPSGAMVEEGQFYIYYGACDTTVCRASVTLNDLLDELRHNPTLPGSRAHAHAYLLDRFEGNPIISPIAGHPWESKFTFNAGTIYAGGKVHILYRAMGDDDTSVFGYASSCDGLHIDERLPEPVYIPREMFELKHHTGFSGCEDPRITVIGDTIYMCYTAYDGINPPRIAMTTIGMKDFLEKRWNWAMPILISAPGVDNKDSCIVPEKINNSYVIFHRINPNIWIDYVSHLSFSNIWIGGHPLFGPRASSWDSKKIGLGGPPEKTPDGWLLIYHGVSNFDDKYRLGAALLDLNNPLHVLARLHNPILEPVAWYENDGYRAGTVFSNGQVIIDDMLYVYYGGADKYTAVAFMPLKKIMDALKSGK
jgi:predicted GH43/DUF377 family glycosyl hydrolase